MLYCYSVVRKLEIMSFLEEKSKTGEHHVKQNEPNSERQGFHVLFCKNLEERGGGRRRKRRGRRKS